MISRGRGRSRIVSIQSEGEDPVKLGDPGFDRKISNLNGGNSQRNNVCSVSSDQAFEDAHWQASDVGATERNLNNLTLSNGVKPAVPCQNNNISVKSDDPFHEHFEQLSNPQPSTCEDEPKKKTPPSPLGFQFKRLRGLDPADDLQRLTVVCDLIRSLVKTTDDILEAHLLFDELLHDFPAQAETMAYVFKNLFNLKVEDVSLRMLVMRRAEQEHADREIIKVTNRDDYLCAIVFLSEMFTILELRELTMLKTAIFDYLTEMLQSSDREFNKMAFRIYERNAQSLLEAYEITNDDATKADPEKPSSMVRVSKQPIVSTVNEFHLKCVKALRELVMDSTVAEDIRWSALRLIEVCPSGRICRRLPAQVEDFYLDKIGGR